MQAAGVGLLKCTLTIIVREHAVIGVADMPRLDDFALGM